MASSVVWLYLAAGPVMEAGGFVARGGPFVVHSPGPDWMWLPILGFLAGLFSAIGNAFLAMATGRSSMLVVWWTALFGSMSVRFLQYGFAPPAGGIAWGWVAPGVVFVLMTIPGVVVLLSPKTRTGFAGTWGVVSLVGAVLGVVGALGWWGVVAG